jgi:hypothetical protein
VSEKEESSKAECESVSDLCFCFMARSSFQTRSS